MSWVDMFHHSSLGRQCTFLQESLANAKVSARQPCWSKTDFDVKLAIKVIHFAINYRGRQLETRGSISPYCWFYLGRFRRSSQ